MEKSEGMPRVHVDEVEAGPARAQGRRPVPSTDVADVLPVHAAGLHRVVGEGRDGQRGRGHRHLAGVEVGAVESVVGKLQSRERAVLVNLVGHPRDDRDVAVVPEAKLDVGSDLRAVVELDLLGAHDRPAPFRLHPAHVGDRGRVPIAHPVAVRHLVEAVAGGHGPDPDGLEQDVEAVIDGHGANLAIRFGPRSPRGGGDRRQKWGQSGFSRFLPASRHRIGKPTLTPFRGRGSAARPHRARRHSTGADPTSSAGSRSRRRPPGSPGRRPR